MPEEVQIDQTKQAAVISQSSDPAAVDLRKATLDKFDINYIKLCRPNGMYLCYLILGIAFVLIPVMQVLRHEAVVYVNLPEPLYWLIEGFFGFYTVARSVEKVKGV